MLFYPLLYICRVRQGGVPVHVMVISRLDSRSSGLGLSPGRGLGKILYSHSAFTLIVSPFTSVYKCMAGAHLDQTSLVNKGFIIWLSGKFFLWDTVGSPERARQLHLACAVSQSRTRIQFILPAHGASHIRNHVVETGRSSSCVDRFL